MVTKLIDIPGIERLNKTEIFSVWSDESLFNLVGGANIREIGTGKVLFHEGIAANDFYFLLAGQIILLTSSAGGREEVVDILQGGELFGEAECFFGGRYHVQAIAAIPSRILVIPLTTFLNALQQHQELMLQMLGKLSLRLHHLKKNLHRLIVESADQRIAGYLLDLCPAGSSAVDLHLPEKKVMIAARLGLTPETFSRTLKRLREEHLIAVEKNKIHIYQPSALRRWADGR